MLPIYSLLAASEEASREASGVWVSSTTTKRSVRKRLCVREIGEKVSLGRLWRLIGLGMWEWSIGGNMRDFVVFWSRLGGESYWKEGEAIYGVVVRIMRKRMGFGAEKRAGEGRRI